MRAITYLLASLRHYWRWHAGLALAVAIGSAVVAGSLAVGDSVRATLDRRSGERLGRVRTALLGNDRFFSEALVRHLPGQAVPVIVVRGTVATADGSARVGQVTVIGAGAGFALLAPGGSGSMGALPPGKVGVNEPLLAALGGSVGGTIIVRIERPGALSKDAPLSGEADQTVTLRAELGSVVPPESFGGFALAAGPADALNVFVPLPVLQEALGVEGRVNAALTDAGAGVESAIATNWSLVDAGLTLRQLPGGAWEVATPRVFLDPPIAARLHESFPGARGVLTYLVNSLRGAGPAATPYSMATATDSDIEAGLDLAGGETAITQWLADDLALKPGDPLTMEFFRFGNGRQLEVQSTSLVVRRILPMDHPAVSPDWTPNFPGVMDKPSCREWKPGIAMDMTAIRDKDEAYWDEHRGTPKLFVSLAHGQELWGNRFGELTSVRLPAETVTGEADFLTKIRQVVQPADFGLSLVAPAEAARAAVDQSYDLGSLFLAMSVFLIATALLLTALMFLFTLESRAGQIGVLMAVGLPPARVRRLVVAEGALGVVIGAVAGIGGAVVYARGVLVALSGRWSNAAGGLDYETSFRTGPMAAGAGVVACLAIATLWFTARRLQRARARDLLAGVKLDAVTRRGATATRESGSAWRVAGAAAAPALWAAAAVLALVAKGNPALFFGSGALLLLGGVVLIGQCLRRWRSAARADGLSGPAQLSLRNAARHSGRSLAIIGLFAAGVFMISAMDAFKLDARTGAGERASGTGGFALIGEATLPIYEDLNSPDGREAFGLEPDDLPGVSVVPFRVREGDEASCLNLERPQNPRVLGVDPQALASRQAFTFSVGDWSVLDPTGSDGAIPAVMDANYVKYTLKSKPGATITVAGEGGESIDLRVAGLLEPSVLQGSAIISEEAFTRAFPNAGGYRFFLIDAPADQRDAISQRLTRMIENRGLAVTSAVRRLDTFNAVQNTYLKIFSALGGLGLILSTAGLGLLLARNVLERRAELGLMQAVGWRAGVLRRMVVAENALLLAAGLGLGGLAALAAVWPVARAVSLPGWTLAAILVGGLVFCALAARLALRGRLIDALRAE